MKAIKSVYCYYFPEVREVVKEVFKNFDHRLLLTSIFPGLDDYHQRLVDTFVDKSTEYQNGLKDFQYKYFCNGSSEAIFHLLIDSQRRGLPIYVFKGEYEGYKEYAKNIGVSVFEVEKNINKIAKLPMGRWFISNPSAVDGNLITNRFVKELCKMGHELIIDVAYLGLTPKSQIDLSDKNIIAVIASMSKPWGLFYFRIGFCFSRTMLPTLYPNKWFKNILSVQIGQRILDKYGFGYFYKKYLPLQKMAIAKMNKETGAKIKASDVLLLANVKTDDKKLAEFKRGESHRFCLTPYFLETEDD